jgi:hypothetical protein
LLPSLECIEPFLVFVKFAVDVLALGLQELLGSFGVTRFNERVRGLALSHPRLMTLDKVDFGNMGGVAAGHIVTAS